MRQVFADSWYWIALTNRHDPWHDAALAASQTLGRVRVVTTEEVLIEFLNFLSKKGPILRDAAAKLVDAVRTDPNVSIVPQTRESFVAGLDLFKGRADKEYSMVDCISMATMRAQHLTEVLTKDKHFEQEGFTLLAGS